MKKIILIASVMLFMLPLFSQSTFLKPIYWGDYYNSKLQCVMFYNVNYKITETWIILRQDKNSEDSKMILFYDNPQDFIKFMEEVKSFYINNNRDTSKEIMGYTVTMKFRKTDRVKTILIHTGTEYDCITLNYKKIVTIIDKLKNWRFRLTITIIKGQIYLFPPSKYEICAKY